MHKIARSFGNVNLNSYVRSELKPSSVLLQGTSWLVEETETDLVVAAYIADDGGFMDMIAIPKSVVAKREKV